MSYKLPEPPWDLIGTPLWERWFDELLCPKCGGQGIDAHMPATPPHFAVYECRSGCGYQTWMPKPRTVAEQKRRRPSRRLDPSETDRCGVCHGTRAELEAIGRTLHACHGVDRADLIEAGLPPDEPTDQGWLCNLCHEIEQALKRDLKRQLAAGEKLA